jgi:hypothetical protein
LWPFFVITVLAQALSTGSMTSPVNKLARALRKPSGAISIALEFSRPAEFGAGMPIRSKDSKDKLQIGGSRGLSATIRNEKAIAIFVSAGNQYEKDSLAAFVQEQVCSA